MSGNTSYHWFWAEWFWFPAKKGYGWKELQNVPGSSVYYPQLEDLHWAMVVGLVLIVARFLIDRIIVVPVAIWLGVPNKPKPTIKPNAQLEDAYRKRKTHDQSTIEVLKKQTDFTQRQVEVWFRKRKAHDAPTPMQKFKECSYNLVFYQTLFIYGMVVLWQKPYFWKTFLCWRDWPFQHVSNDMYWYYVIELGFYWSLLYTYFSDHKRKDFLEMIVHHFATITLLYFSWIMNFVRAGALVLAVHDTADSWLALTKMSIYLKKKRATDVFFLIFVLMWVATRVVIYPLVILNCTTFEPYYETIDETFGSHQFFNFFLYVLQILHLLWTYMIFRIIYRKAIRGNVEDVRSDSEDSDNDAAYEDDGEDTSITGKGTNGDVKNSPLVNGNVQKRQKQNGPTMHDSNGLSTEIVSQNGASLHVNKEETESGKSMSPSKIPKIKKIT